MHYSLRKRSYFTLLLEVSREIVDAKEVWYIFTLLVIKSKLGDMYLTLESGIVNWVTFTLGKY